MEFSTTATTMPCRRGFVLFHKNVFSIQHVTDLDWNWNEQRIVSFVASCFDRSIVVVDRDV